MNLKLLLVLSALLGLSLGFVLGQAHDSAEKQAFSEVESGLIGKLDSIQRLSITHYGVLEKSYDSIMNSASISIDGLYSKIDSLQKQGVATDHLTMKLDSITKVKDKGIATITSNVEKLKAVVNNRINELNLPPELREQANKITSVIDKLDITKPNVIEEYLNVSVPDLGQMNISGVDISKPLPDVGNFNAPSIGSGTIGEQIKEYQNTVGNLPTDVNGIAKLAEENVNNVSAITDVQNELGKISEVTLISDKLKDQEAIKKELLQEAKKQAIDHFAGKGEQLNKAIESISKYKQKFSSIGSLNDLPKKAPNEMKGKPLIERIVPGVALQLQKKDDDLLLDFNLYFGYRFTKRFTSGGGWNQRVGFNTDKNAWCSENARIYGPRIFSEYKLGKGFSPRVEVELMNTFVPPFVKKVPVDPGSREWVWGAFVGMKKDYTLYKKIKGTAMIMLRLFDPERKSPYADVVNARFGFEFPMKHP